MACQVCKEDVTSACTLERYVIRVIVDGCCGITSGIRTLMPLMAQQRPTLDPKIGWEMAFGLVEQHRIRLPLDV